MAHGDAAGVNGSNRILSHGAPPRRMMPNGCLESPVLVLLPVLTEASSWMPIRGGDSVDIVDVTAGKIVKNLPVKAPHNCYNAQRNDHVWVTSMGDNKVNLIDLKTLTYLAEIPVGGIPRPLAVTHDETTLYCQLSDLHGFVVVDG